MLYKTWLEIVAWAERRWMDAKAFGEAIFGSGKP